MGNSAELHVQLWKHEWQSKAQGISGNKMQAGRQTGGVFERQETQTWYIQHHISQEEIFPFQNRDK